MLKEEERRKVDRMKTIPIREKTEETLSVMDMVRIWSGVSGGVMLAEHDLLYGLEDGSSRPVSCYLGVLAQRVAWWAMEHAQ